MAAGKAFTMDFTEFLAFLSLPFAMMQKPTNIIFLPVCIKRLARLGQVHFFLSYTYMVI
jgi:hypothetical protein